MKVLKLKKILEQYRDDAEIKIFSINDKSIQFDIEMILKTENVFYDGYGKFSELEILLTKKRKRG